MKKTMKKILCSLIVVVMCLTMVPLQGFVGFDLKAEAIDYKVGDIIQFGSYPQSEVKNETVIEILNNLAPEWDDWTSYDYYSGNENVGSMKQGDWMRYTDVTYGGNKYRGVKFTQYRPYWTVMASKASQSHQDDHGYVTDVAYWFIFEEINWRVLDPSSGLVLSETIIDSQAFNNTSYQRGNGTYDFFNNTLHENYANDYEASSIREWLNDDFYNVAFNENEKNAITTTELNNSGYYTSIGTSGYEQLDSKETNDKIYLLSYNEARNEKFGFNASNTSYDKLRVAYGSDYAKCQGLGVAQNGFVTWHLRSPGFHSNYCSLVHENGLSYGYDFFYYVYDADLGVRPALRLKGLSTTNNIYNLGEETYSFKNFGDEDSAGGHCFGMSATSSGYYLGLLSKSNIGLNNGDTLYSLNFNSTVKTPICHYQVIQGKARDESIVAGGTYFKYWPFYNIKSDWKEIVNYVKNHEHDGAGDLIIGYTKKSEGCHAINFLRYEVVDGQERIYAYDSNFPDKETYFYQDVNDYVRQAVRSTFSGSIDCIALVDVNEFFSRTGNFIMAKTFYAPANSIEIEGAYVSPMCVGETTDEILMYEILDEETEVVVTPLVDNATFTYMDNEYSFDKINEDTYAEFTLSTSEEDEPVFEIINAPHEHVYAETKTAPTCTEKGFTTYTCACGDSYIDSITEIVDHTDDNNDELCDYCDKFIGIEDENKCTHMCHQSGFMSFIWKIINFFQKLFGMNPVCECGAAHY